MQANDGIVTWTTRSRRTVRGRGRVARVVCEPDTRARRPPSSAKDVPLFLAYDLITMNQPAMTGPCGPRPRWPGAGGGASGAGGGTGPRSG